MSQATSVILAWLSLGLMSAGAAPSKVPHGDVELVPAVKSIESGAPVTVGLLFHLEEGWHIYWKNPGDSGQPPRLKWELPRGMTAGAIEWPTPKRLPVGPLLDYGYEKTVLLPIPIQTESGLAGPQELKAGLRVLVCRETCMPGKADLSLTLPVAKRTPAANPQYSALFAQTLAEKPSAAPANWQVNAKQSGTQFLLSVKGAPKEASLSYIPAEANVIRNAAAQKNAAGPNGQTLRLERADGATGKVATLSGLLLVKQGGRSEAYEISSPVTGPAATVDRTAVESAPLTQGRSLFAILLLAFGGGLILNLMPCVFPVLSIKVLSLLEHYGGERKTVQVSGLLYTAGVLASFWALVGVLLSLRGAGRNLGWGFQLQSPGFVAFLICLLFGLGLSLAGVFEIGTSVMNTGSSLTQRGTYSSSFFTGVLADRGGDALHSAAHGRSGGVCAGTKRLRLPGNFHEHGFGAGRAVSGAFAIPLVEPFSAEAGRMDGDVEAGNGVLAVCVSDLAAVGVGAAGRYGSAGRNALRAADAGGGGLDGGPVADKQGSGDYGGSYRAGDGGGAGCGAETGEGQCGARNGCRRIEVGTVHAAEVSRLSRERETGTGGFHGGVVFDVSGERSRSVSFAGGGAALEPVRYYAAKGGLDVLRSGDYRYAGKVWAQRHSVLRDLCAVRQWQAGDTAGWTVESIRVLGDAGPVEDLKSQPCASSGCRCLWRICARCRDCRAFG